MKFDDLTAVPLVLVGLSQTFFVPFQELCSAKPLQVAICMTRGADSSPFLRLAQ